MMTAQEIREKKFEKAAWGYRPEDIDEFLGQLEATFQEIDNEREDSNHKIQVLADKVREYMKDEEALKDALLGAQKEGHRVVKEANEKADQILNRAKEEAAMLLDEATRQHEIAMEKNRAEIAREKEALAQVKKMVADFKRSLFDMYKGHLENKVKTNDELILDYENNLRTEIELTTPLISEDFKIDVLIEEYKDNEEYSKSIENITKKYKYIRKVRRDGNCFYRSFIFRLFEYICIKNQKTLFEKIKQKIVNAKELTTKNGYEWTVVEDFYNLFLKEFTDCFNSLTQKTTIRDYLNNLFKDKNRSNYLIYFIRFCIAAYLKDQRETYQVYIEGSFDDWVRNEVEEIDHEADQIQIMACVNYFEVGVQIEYLNKNQREVVKLPYDKPDDQFFIFLLFTPGHYDILYP